MNAPGTTFIDDTAEIIAELNALAPTLGPELLPNGYRLGNLWKFSGIPDHGGSDSAWLHLNGPNQGFWNDAGNAAPDEQHGDMLDLLRHKRCGGDKRRAFEEARVLLGRSRGGQRIELTPAEKERRAAEARRRQEDQLAKQQAERVKKAKGAKALWLSARPIEGTGAADYLRCRDLAPGPSGKWPGSLRFRDDIYHGALQAKYPALLGAIYTFEGEQIGTHRIFLARHPRLGWGKLQGAPAKMVLGNVGGGFVPIERGASGKSMREMPAGEPVYMTEGIEDAIAVRMIKPEARIIAGVNLGNMGAVLLPEQAGPLVIVADRDEGDRAQVGLEGAIARQQSRGLTVQLVVPPREVAGEPVKDINDWVRALVRQKREVA